MGYESKLYFVKDFGFKPANDKFGLNCSDIIAILDMSKMGYGYYDDVTKFVKMFDTETPFSLSVPTVDEDGNERYMEVIEDPYGKRLCYCKDKSALLRQADLIIQHSDPYDRFYYMRDMIKAFEDKDDIYIVHYGY